tara:strand:+ start:397 stop:639 length:243 start_codon:yes stop_codon:yes gene_type:complete
MKTELQKKFEKQTPTIKGVGRIEYLQTFVSWQHLQIENSVNYKKELIEEILDIINSENSGLNHQQRLSEIEKLLNQNKDE